MRCLCFFLFSFFVIFSLVGLLGFVLEYQERYKGCFFHDE